MPPEGGRARDLLIVRHGETEWNRQRRVMGALDVPLSPTGRSQCEKLAKLLGGFGVDRIVSSPLARAAESAAVLADALGLGVEQDENLSEVRFGRWQGQTYEEVVRDPDYHRFIADPVHTRTPGGETIAQVQQRGLMALGRARDGERTVFVSHGDIIRATLCHFLAIPVAEFRRLRVDNSSVSAVVHSKERLEVKFINVLPDPERAWDPLHWSRGI
jgi:broad specificity phosphatase PhoE